MHILLVNDDGIDASGFRRLTAELGKDHRVTVCAPDGNRSAVGHGITLGSALTVHRTKLPGAVNAYGISGTPGDCVRLGLSALVDEPVDLVISGPNVGLNVGMDLHYSGTVSAALEAAMQGVKAIAVSAPPMAEEREVIRIFLRLLEQVDLDTDLHHALNINLPALPLEEVKGVKWVPQGLFFPWIDRYEPLEPPEGEDPQEGAYRYQVQGTICPLGEDSDTDVTAVLHGYAALTPITFSFTDDRGFPEKEFAL